LPVIRTPRTVDPHGQACRGLWNPIGLMGYRENAPQALLFALAPTGERVV
jgi:hypothetical protein